MAAETKQVTRFSPTALKTYHECPRKWDWQYRQRIEAEPVLTPHLVLGQAVHTALAALHRVPVGARDEAMAHRLLRAAWSKIERSGVFLSDEDEADWGERALAMLSGYCAEWPLAVRPLELEAWVRARLPGGIELFGRADRIEISQGEPWLIEVVDYKTGKCRMRGDDPAAELYALAATRTYNRLVGRVRFIFLRDGRELVWTPESDDLAAAEQRLRARVEGILADEDLSPTPGFHCRWCQFAPICDARDQLPELAGEAVSF